MVGENILVLIVALTSANAASVIGMNGSAIPIFLDLASSLIPSD